MKGFAQSLFLKWILGVGVLLGVGYAAWYQLQPSSVRRTEIARSKMNETKAQEKVLDEAEEVNKIDLQAPKLPILLDVTINR